MSQSLSSIMPNPFSKLHSTSTTSTILPLPPPYIVRVRNRSLVTKTQCCAVNEQSSPNEVAKNGSSKLGIGSPVIITEAPKMIKTAASVPCIRANSNLVKPGDVGRIVSRKPMDVWAIRLGIGTYLIDRKYFKLLELDE